MAIFSTRAGGIGEDSSYPNYLDPATDRSGALQTKAIALHTLQSRIFHLGERPLELLKECPQRPQYF
jgi:hypothetical protein